MLEYRKGMVKKPQVEEEKEIHIMSNANLWVFRLSMHRGKSGTAGTKRGQLLYVKVERHNQPKFPK